MTWERATRTYSATAASTAMPPVEWSYDASTSRVLRVVAHLPAAGIGGAFLLAAGLLAASVVTSPGLPDPRVLLFAGLLLLVGSPFSLLYLWPMLTDPEQRPSSAEFAGAEGFPFTLRSVVSAAVLGAVCIAGAVALGVPVDLVYGVVVALVFSTLGVAMVTAHGRLDDGELTVNGTGVPLEQVTRVRSVRLGDVVVCWISYASGSGLFLPRLFVVPERRADDVLATLRSGAGRSPDRRDVDSATKAVLVGTGLVFLAVGVVAFVAIEERAVGGYLAAIVGAIGILFCIAGWRGL